MSLLSTRACALVLTAQAALFTVGCSAESSAPAEDDTGDVAITSTAGKVFDFAFDAEVVAASETPARQAIVEQLQYVQGALTTDVKGNGQVGLVDVTKATETSLGGGKKRIVYSAVLPVLWPKDVATPRSYTLSLPKDATTLDAFNRKYDGRCGTNEYGVETFWHDFNPKARGCSLDAADVVERTVRVQKSVNETTGKYPEYDRVLTDDAIDVVAVFGIISSNTPSDEGAREMENVIRETSRDLTDVVRRDSGASASVIKSTVLTGKVVVKGKPRTVTLTALLTEELASAGPDLDAIYGPASEKADLIVYSGHSGLGKNINSLAERSKVAKGKYQLLYLNGCQSFAYLGRGLHDKKMAANGADDPKGTKYLDVVANALPAFGDDGRTGLLVYRALLAQDRPKTFDDLLGEFPTIHLAASFGDEDNVFRP